MSARDELDRWQAEAQTNAVLGRTATQENARQMLAAVKALRDVLDEHRPIDDGPPPECRVCADALWEPTPWPCPTVQAIEAAIGGEGR